MAITAPNLDDRRFQDLVDDAKRMVMDRCPTWTDHNVSDPGITLIETFAFMTDQMLFRLNRVPDRLYVKFLELIGIRLFPPTAAHVDVTFWLSTPPSTEHRIAANTRVATTRTETEDPIVFSTLRDLAIVPTRLVKVMTMSAHAEGCRDRTASVEVGDPFPVFDADAPGPGDTLYVGLDQPAPHNAVALTVECRIDGVGVDPTDPPLVWEAWTGTSWTTCELERDETGGLNRRGQIVVHVPPGHVPNLVDGERAAWLRARVTEPHEGQPEYTTSPVLHAVTVATGGGTTEAVHVEQADPETLGESTGRSGQRFAIPSGPVVDIGTDPVVEVSSDDGWETWTIVDGFIEFGPHDRVVVLDAAAGAIEFGPSVRFEDGSVRQYGAVPGPGATVRIRRHAVGGGRRGNVAPGAIRTLKSSIPFVHSVTNRRSAIGGVDAESVEEAKVRGPLLLRTRGRAVTREDFELITREAAPEVARVRCIAADTVAEAGHVTICIVPAVPHEDGRLRFEDLLPTESTLSAIAERLEDCRIIGSTVHVEPPTYQGVTVVARVRATPRADADRVHDEARATLHRYFDPLVGGPDGTGWPWGRPVQAGDAFGILQQVAGVDVVEDVRLFGANPVTGERGQQTDRLELAANSLVFSYEHLVQVMTP